VTVDRDFATVVAGGGPAGAAAAISLARLGHQVLLVDDSVGGFKLGEALAPAARPLLRDLSVLEHFLADGHLACHGNISAWGSSEAQFTDFVSNPHGHGWHLDRARFDAMLRNEARDCGAAVWSEARFTCAEQLKCGWRVTFRLGESSRRSEEVRAGWLIDATGRRSVIARWLRAQRIHEDHLVAFYVRFRPSQCADRDEESRTIVEAAPDGWWYSALVPSGERIVAFLTDSDLADRAALRSMSGFTNLLGVSQHVGQLLRFHGYQPDSDPRGADAGTARLHRFGGTRWLAVGDAAISFDPLSSQGILNALYMGMKAGQAISQSLSGDPGLVDDYLQRLENIYNAYRTTRKEYYAAERRWHDRPFWRRRAKWQ
jgi:flavin-dependent dehydrogenase